MQIWQTAGPISLCFIKFRESTKAQTIVDRFLQHFVKESKIQKFDIISQNHNLYLSEFNINMDNIQFTCIYPTSVTFYTAKVSSDSGELREGCKNLMICLFHHLPLHEETETRKSKYDRCWINASDLNISMFSC